MTHDNIAVSATDYESSSQRQVGQHIAQWLDLHPLPGEGGLFRRTHIDEHSSAIYFMLLSPDFSALHRLQTTEIYHFYAGAPLRMLLLESDGSIHEPVLGPDIEAGQQPQIAVSPGIWQGSSSSGEWTLVGTTSAPPFGWGRFELGDRTSLRSSYPAAEARIAELTHD